MTWWLSISIPHYTLINNKQHSCDAISSHWRERKAIMVNSVCGLMGVHVEWKVCPDTSKDKVVSIWTSWPLRWPMKALLNVIVVCKGIYLHLMTVDIIKANTGGSSLGSQAWIPLLKWSQMYQGWQTLNSLSFMSRNSYVFKSQYVILTVPFPIPSHLTMAGYWVAITCSPYLPYFEFSRVLS